jgi:dephospho-CoA kinase
MPGPATRPLRVGLTGGIGSGKSTVAASLRELGAAIIDTDTIARRLTGPAGAAMAALRQEFGQAIITADGALDRVAMRALAFADPAARRRLEAVLHPLIGLEAEREAAGTTCALVVFDVPLLAESQHWRARVERVLVVDCSEATQVARVLQRHGWSADTVWRVIASQAPRAARRAIADAVIFNDGLSREALAAEVQALWAEWRALLPHPVEQ